MSISNSSLDNACPVVEIAPPSRLSQYINAPPAWLPPLFFLLCSILFLWKSIFAGDVFLPAGLLGHAAPWKGMPVFDPLPPWNPLRWDGIAQFYPWRHFAAATVRSGRLPLWNPYQFCGTPFVANSQSAVFYPGNLLFYILPDIARAFALSAALHLTLCGWFLYLLLRRMCCSPVAALLGGVIFAFSAWEVSWLQLPSFLATSCWIPLILCQVQLFCRENKQSAILPLALSVGMMLLAGHLQIAFYGLLAGILWTVGLLILASRNDGLSLTVRKFLACVGALVLGFMLAAPQLLPSIELSRMSHRVGKPNRAGYAAYTEYALPLSGLIMLAVPEFFGGDSDPGNPYWGFYTKRFPDGSSIPLRHNASETAFYVGIVPALLAILALVRIGRGKLLDKRTLFFGLLGLLALLLAFGTPLNALFYFGIPGFGQSGSPARALVLWALASAALAAFGLDALIQKKPTRKELGFLLAFFVISFLLGISAAARSLVNSAPGHTIPTVTEALLRIGAGWLRVVLFFLAGVSILIFRKKEMVIVEGDMADLSHGSPTGFAIPVSVVRWAALCLVLFDLFLTGIAINPTAKREQVYPATEAIKMMQEGAGHDRIFPVNQQWGLYKAPPVVFPPNAATVFQLRDVQGYDSLLTGQYKTFANSFALPNKLGTKDASPAEVGNMVFFQNPNYKDVPETAAQFVITPITDASTLSPAVSPGSPQITGDESGQLYRLNGARHRAEMVSQNGAMIKEIVWQEDEATRVVIETNSPSEGKLILRDQFYPGWHVFIDNRPAELNRYDKVSIFRSVEVPEGHHTVAFLYQPASFMVGLYLALFAVVLLVLISIIFFSISRISSIASCLPRATQSP